MKKSDVVLMGVFCMLGVISFPEIAELNMQSFMSGICLGAATAMLAAGLIRQTNNSQSQEEQ